MQVQPEPTPNPNAIKFTLDRPATDGGAETFKAGSDPAAAPVMSRVPTMAGPMPPPGARDTIGMSEVRNDHDITFMPRLTT